MFILAEHKIRPFAQEDIARDVVWRNSNRFLANSCNDRRVSVSGHATWFDRLAGTPARYLVLERKDVPIGVVHFHDIAIRDGRANWGLYVGDENEPCGTGTALGFCGIEYGFNVLGLRKLVAEIMSCNERSLRLHRKLGFAREGYLAKHVVRSGAYEDMVMCALFSDDWRLKVREVVGSLLFSDWP